MKGKIKHIDAVISADAVSRYFDIGKFRKDNDISIRMFAKWIGGVSYQTSNSRCKGERGLTDKQYYALERRCRKHNIDLSEYLSITMKLKRTKIREQGENKLNVPESSVGVEGKPVNVDSTINVVNRLKEMKKEVGRTKKKLNSNSYQSIDDIDGSLLIYFLKWLWGKIKGFFK